MTANEDPILVALARIEERQQAHLTVHTLEASARVIAANALAKELEGLNQVRQRFISREAYEGQHSTLMLRVDALEDWRAKATGAAMVAVLLAGAVGGAITKALGG